MPRVVVPSGVYAYRQGQRLAENVPSENGTEKERNLVVRIAVQSRGPNSVGSEPYGEQTTGVVVCGWWKRCEVVVGQEGGKVRSLRVREPNKPCPAVLLRQHHASVVVRKEVAGGGRR